MINRLLLTVATIFVFHAFVSSQEPELGRLKAYSAVPSEALQSRLDNYSKNDLELFRAILDLIKAEPAESDWEGHYIAGGPNEVGFSTLRFKFQSGFASLYIYTCTPELRDINFGQVIDSEDMIQLVSEIPDGSPRKHGRIKLVKVTWGDRRYLVALRSLAAFAEKAAGVFVPSEDGGGPEWSDFWENGDSDSKLMGSPRFPARFRYLERSAIETKIIDVRPRRIFPEFSTGRTFHSAKSAVYRVVINAGRRQGVKKGLILNLNGTEEELTITRVASTTSEGVVVRALDDTTLADHCLSDEAKLIQCPKITRGATVSTIVGNFFF